MTKVIHHVTISNKIYLPYFKRFGPITSPERIDDILLKSFKNMGYNVTIVKTEVIDPNLGVISNLVEQTVENKEEETIVPTEDTSSTSSIEDVSDNELELETDNEEEFIFPSKEEINKMTVVKLQKLLNHYIESIDESDLPLENKTKKQLIAIANKIISE
jgi:hypothetical protein